MDDASLPDNDCPQRRTRVTAVLLPLRPKLFVDFHMGAIGGCSGRKPRSADDEKKLPLLSVSH